MDIIVNSVNTLEPGNVQYISKQFYLAVKIAINNANWRRANTENGRPLTDDGAARRGRRRGESGTTRGAPAPPPRSHDALLRLC